MASTGVNVLRYSALGAGVVYGFWHQSKLSAAAKASAINKEYQHKQSLISQAKAEYTKKTQPQSPKSSGDNDPNDPRFDLEAYLTKLSTENP